MQVACHDQLEPARPILHGNHHPGLIPAGTPKVKLTVSNLEVAALQVIPQDEMMHRLGLPLSHEGPALGIVVREDHDDGGGNGVDGDREVLGGAGAAGTLEGVPNELVEGAVDRVVFAMRHHQERVNFVGVAEVASCVACDEIH